MKMPLLLIRPKIVLKNLLIKKGGCFECYAVTGNKTEYYRVYIERLFAPFKGWVNALFSYNRKFLLPEESIIKMPA